MQENYYPSRTYSVEKIQANFGFDLGALANALGQSADEPTRIGDLGCGQGIMATYLIGEGYHVVGIDPRPSPLIPDSFTLVGNYPEVHFTHRPHLIYAHYSVAALDPTHPFFHHYAQFHPTITQIIKDLDPTVGTAVITGYFNPTRNLNPSLSYALTQGFTIFTTNFKTPDQFILIMTKAPELLKKLSHNDLKAINPPF